MGKKQGTTPAVDIDKASRIRKRLRAGKPVTDEDAAWLRAYVERSPRLKAHGTRLAAETPAPAAAPAEAFSPIPLPPPPEPVHTFQPPPAPVHEAPPMTVLDFGAVQPPPSPMSTSLVRTGCSIPDCQECKRSAGSTICGTTGKRVWPGMSLESAKLMARGVFNAIGFVLRIMKGGRVLVTPTKDEIDQLGKSIQMIQMRRASVIGAYDDLFIGVAALAQYGTRWSTEQGNAAALAAEGAT